MRLFEALYFSFLFKILFNFSLFFFPVWPLHARYVNSETLTCNLVYFANTNKIHYCRACCRRDGCLFCQPCLFHQPHWRNVILSRHVLLIVMAKSFKKQIPLIITFKTNKVSEKICKTDPLELICCYAAQKRRVRNFF